MHRYVRDPVRCDVPCDVRDPVRCDVRDSVRCDVRDPVHDPVRCDVRDMFVTKFAADVRCDVRDLFIKMFVTLFVTVHKRLHFWGKVDSIYCYPAHTAPIMK